MVEAENAHVKAKQQSQAENLKDSKSHTFKLFSPNCQPPPSPSPSPAQTTSTPNLASDGAHCDIENEGDTPPTGNKHRCSTTILSSKSDKEDSEPKNAPKKKKNKWTHTGSANENGKTKNPTIG